MTSEIEVPTRSYIIWFSQRTGSTLLCKALTSTGVAGKPDEWLLANDIPELLARYEAGTPEALRQKLWAAASTSNSVCALKLSMYESYHTQLIDFFRLLPGESGKAGNWGDVWASVLPNCKHIFVTRRNKVRLAVSWWKAICSDEWHRRSSERATAKDVHDSYNYEAINHLLCEATLREAAIQELFSEAGIVPLTLVYEDFVEDLRGKVETVLDFLDTPRHEQIAVEQPYFAKLADEVSEAWVQRFRRERQQGWTNTAW